MALTCGRQCALWSLDSRPSVTIEPKGGQTNISDDEVKNNLKSLYTQLAAWQTRVCELLPGSGQDELKCRLHKAELIAMDGLGISNTFQVVHYEALSYSWTTSMHQVLDGESDTTSKALIICNDLPITISTSLATALLYLREQETSRYVWCDALCIDQVNMAEKARQIRNLLQIFEKARRVIAWIGLPDMETSDSLVSTSMLFQALESPEIRSGLIEGDFLEGHDPACRTRFNAILQSLKKHMHRPWFSRTWVRQEVFAALDVQIQCGLESVDIHHFKTFVDKFKDIWLSGGDFCDSGYSGENKAETKDTISWPYPLTAHVLLTDLQHGGTASPNFRPPQRRIQHEAHWVRKLDEGSYYRATDARDQVYGLLGMIQSPSSRQLVEVEKRNSPPFPIDYNKSVSEVYQDVIKYLINENLRLSVLDYFDNRPALNPLLPSWLPDWRITKQRYLYGTPDSSAGPTRYWLSQPIKGPTQDHNDLGRLRVEGTKLGIVYSLNDQHLPNSWPCVPELPDISSRTYLSKYKRGSVMASSATTVSQTPSPLLQFYVPPATVVDDWLVKFRHAEFYHVIRPTTVEGGEYLFVGAVAAMLSGTYQRQAQIAGVRAKLDGWQRDQESCIFTLV